MKTESRFGGWVETYTGKIIYPLDPREDEIDIVDIAHALSHICRFTGHTDIFYSVGAHSYICELVAHNEGYNSRIQMLCLLHDASEAYLADVAKPIKEFFADYVLYEKKLMGMILRKYIGDYTEEELGIAKDIDYRVLKNEARLFMKSSGTIWNDYNPSDFNQKIIETINSVKDLETEDIRSNFIGRFNFLVGEVGYGF